MTSPDPRPLTPNEERLLRFMWPQWRQSRSIGGAPIDMGPVEVVDRLLATLDAERAPREGDASPKESAARAARSMGWATLPPLRPHPGHAQVAGAAVSEAGWWHPAECSNVHDEGGNCIEASSGMIVGWREEITGPPRRAAR